MLSTVTYISLSVTLYVIYYRQRDWTQLWLSSWRKASGLLHCLTTRIKPRLSALGLSSSVSSSIVSINSLLLIWLYSVWNLVGISVSFEGVIAKGFYLLLYTIALRTVLLLPLQCQVLEKCSVNSVFAWLKWWLKHD